MNTCCPRLADLTDRLLLPQADALAGSDWRAVRAVGSAASCGVNAVPAALEAMLVRDAGFPGEVLSGRSNHGNEQTASM